MADTKYPRVLPLFYDPEFDLKTKGPAKLAGRACAEVRGLADDFALIGNRLSNDLRYRNLDDVARRLAFDYEDYLHRVHCIRERSWDVLTGTSPHGHALLRDCNPRQLGTPKKQDREVIKAEIKATHPKLHSAFIHLQQHLEQDLALRHVATHQTHLWLALMPNEHDAREINDYDYPADGNKAERAARTIVRGLLRQFVADQKQKIKTILSATMSFVAAGQTATHCKRQKTLN